MRALGPTAHEEPRTDSLITAREATVTLESSSVLAAWTLVWAARRDGVAVFCGWEKGWVEGGRVARWREMRRSRAGVSTRRRSGGDGNVGVNAGDGCT